MSQKLGVNGTKRGLAPPSPSPSNASNTSHGTPSKRVKREKTSIAKSSMPAVTPAAAAAAATNFGDNKMTNLIYAQEYLKEKKVPKTLQEILSHLSLQAISPEDMNFFAKAMEKHPQIKRIVDSKKRDDYMAGTYEFVAKIPGVNSKETLLAYLQKKTDASKLDVKDLEDGWEECKKAINELEAQHKLLVVRTKKDGIPRYVWIDSPDLFHPVDPEFRQMWQRVELPSLDDIVRKLSAVGQKPASADPRLIKKETKPQAKQKRRVNKASKKQTNVHMQALLRDYSHLRRG